MVKGYWALTSSAIIKVSNGVEDHLVCIFHPNPASDYDTNRSLEITQAAIGNEQFLLPSLPAVGHLVSRQFPLNGWLTLKSGNLKTASDGHAHNPCSHSVI
jgi:hypothetical protein